MTPTYSKINPQELADMKEKYGPWLDEQEVLYLIKREREQGMREELFSTGSEGAGVTANQRLLGPDNSVEGSLTLAEGSLTPAAQGAPTDPTKLPRVTCEQIASFSPRLWFYLAGAIVLEALVLRLIEGWLR